MNPGAWSLLLSTHRAVALLLLTLAIVALAVTVTLVGAAWLTDAAPGGDALLGPFRWVPLSERGLA